MVEIMLAIGIGFIVGYAFAVIENNSLWLYYQYYLSFDGEEISTSSDYLPDN